MLAFGWYWDKGLGPGVAWRHRQAFAMSPDDQTLTWLRPALRDEREHEGREREDLLEREGILMMARAGDD